jgi:hypothetical protein
MDRFWYKTGSNKAFSAPGEAHGSLAVIGGEDALADCVAVFLEVGRQLGRAGLELRDVAR